MKELFIVIVAVAGFIAGMKYHDHLYPELTTPPAQEEQSGNTVKE